MTPRSNAVPTEQTSSHPSGARIAKYLMAGVGCSLLATWQSDAAVIAVPIDFWGGPNGGLFIGGQKIGFFPGVPGDPNTYAAMRLYAVSNNRWGLRGTTVGSANERFLELGASGSSADPTNFATGASIGATSPTTWTQDASTFFQDGAAVSPDFGPNSFMGFRCSIDSGVNWIYGYIEVTWNSTDQIFEVLSAAYESNLNQSIGAGATPIPGAGGLMALMALGGGAFRRRGRSA